MGKTEKIYAQSLESDFLQLHLLHSRHDIDATCKFNAIESAKNEDDVKPEKTTIHASNNNNAAEVHEEKSAESHPLLPLLNLL